jgi:peptidoglycan/LPS O-acetylase OafA/YrhL
VTEQVLNLVWLLIASVAFAVVLPSVRRRRTFAAVALAGILVLLFPIISISDDLHPDWVAYEVLAVLFAIVGLVVVFSAIARLVTTYVPQLTVVTIDLSDPRSPPAR